MRSTFLIAIAIFPLCAAEFPVTDLSRLEVSGIAVQATYKGKAALKLTDKDGGPNESLAVLKGQHFHNGTIELEVAGTPGKNADPAARGFIGMAFRSAGNRFELIYIRPTNGRAPDQLRRNHSTQYASSPDWGWKRLRDEFPGQYESYVDLQDGEWTRMRIVVKGTDASLYIGGSEQPCLIVHQMKLGDITGGVALWSGSGTEGYFRNVTIKAED